MVSSYLFGYPCARRWHFLQSTPWAFLSLFPASRIAFFHDTWPGREPPCFFFVSEITNPFYIPIPIRLFLNFQPALPVGLFLIILHNVPGNPETLREVPRAFPIRNLPDNIIYQRHIPPFLLALKLFPFILDPIILELNRHNLTAAAKGFYWEKSTPCWRICSNRSPSIPARSWDYAKGRGPAEIPSCRTEKARWQPWQSHSSSGWSRQ